MGDASNGQHKTNGENKSSKATKKKWTPKEDAVLIAALSELSNAGWKKENGNFRSGYTAALERKIKSKLPGHNIKASPHIESRLKLLKRQYEAITEMQGEAGMHFDNNESVLTCEDDDVWENWIQNHSDAKGLRNKQFPYYNDLHILFGNRGARKGVSNELDGDKALDHDEDNNYDVTNLMIDDTFEEEEDNIGNYEVFQNGSSHKEIEKQYKQRKEITENILNHVEDSDRFSEDTTGTKRSNDENHLPSTKKKKCDNESGSSSELGELAKIFGTFLDKYQEHLSLLGEIVGREKAAEKIAGEKRARLNGELMKLPNLNLQARLRAASLIVSDPAKIDLFYSLSKEERREWVSMLLTGLV